MVYGLPVVVEILIWITASFVMAAFWRRFVPTVGFFTGCALGPVALLAAGSPATKGSRVAIAIGGVVGSLFYSHQIGWI